MDIFEELIELGKRRGMLTYDEINEVLPSEFYTLNELEEFMDLLDDMGVKVTDSEEAGIFEEGLDEEEETGEREKSEDLVQAYFHSMGEITILKRTEEVELAKRLEEGKRIIGEIIATLPLYKKNEAEIAAVEQHGKDEEVNENERQDEFLSMSLKMFDDRMERIAGTDGKVARCGTLKDLKTLISREKKTENIPVELTSVAKEAQSEYKTVEEEVGINVETLRGQWQRLLNARAMATETKNELITRNLRLVINVAKNYLGRGLPFLDLIQEGNIGLMRAVDKFKYERGFKFSTYATWWIRQAITRALIDQAKTIRVPVHMMEFYSRVVKTSRELTSRLLREPSADEIAKSMKVSTTKVEEVFRAVQDSISLQTPLGDEDTELADFIRDTTTPSPYASAEKNELTEQILLLLKTLTPVEEKVIRMRFGIGADREHTLEEVGTSFSLTRERIRQIEAKALKKLKHPGRIKAFQVLTVTLESGTRQVAVSRLFLKTNNPEWTSRKMTVRNAEHMYLCHFYLMPSVACIN